MIHHCSYCNYKSSHKWVVKRHMENKHQNQNILNSEVQQPLETQLKTSYMKDYPQVHPAYHGQVFHQQPVYSDQVAHQQPVQDNVSQISMDTDSVDSDTKSVSTDGEDTDEDRENNDDDEEKENVDTLHNSIRKIYHNFLQLKGLRDEYRRALKNVKNFDMEQLRDILKEYADLEVEILEEQVGVDPEENGDENVEDESEDDNGDNEEKDTCTKCEKGCMFDFVFEMREVIEDEEKEILENIIEKKKNEFLKIKESENNDDTDNEEDELNTKSDIAQKYVENVENVYDKFRKDGSLCFEDCSKSKIQSVCDMCGIMNDNLAWNKLKRKYPNKYAKLDETIQKLRKDGVSKLSNPHVTIHNKRKTLQKAQVGEGILNILKNLILPELKESLNIR